MDNQHSLLALARDLAGSIRTYATDPRNRWKTVAIAAGFSALLVYAILRSTVLDASDLRNGYLHPTRAVLYCGKDIYRDFPNNSFPAFFYCVVAPFAQFTDGVAAVLWYVLSVGLFFGINGLVIRMLKTTSPPGVTGSSTEAAADRAPHRACRGVPVVSTSTGPRPDDRCVEATGGRSSTASRPGPRMSYFIAPLLCSVILADNLYLGQSNIMTLFFVCASLYSYLHGKDVRAGVWLSLGICFKVTPALFLLFYLMKLRLKVLAGVAAGLVVFLVIVPALFFGPVKSLHYVRGWSEMILMPYVKGERVKSVNVTWKHTNQSLDAFLHRTFTDYAERKYGGLHRTLALVRLSEPAVNRLSKLVKVGLVALLVLVLVRLRGCGMASLPWEGSIFLMTMLYLSPISWSSHYMAVLVPYAVMVHTIINLPKKDPGRRILFWALAVGMGFSVFNLTPTLQSYSFLFVGNAVVFAGLLAYALVFVPRRAGRQS